MAMVVDVLSWALLLAGSFFLVVGAVGLNRMPDLYTRIHAVGVSDTLGAGFLIFGMMLQAGFTLVTVKLVFLLLIFFFTSPVASHAVTRAALAVGVEPKLFDEQGRPRKGLLREVRAEKTKARPAPAKPKAKTAPRRKPVRSKGEGKSSKR